MTAPCVDSATTAIEPHAKTTTDGTHINVLLFLVGRDTLFVLMTTVHRVELALPAGKNQSRCLSTESAQAKARFSLVRAVRCRLSRGARPPPRGGTTSDETGGVDAFTMGMTCVAASGVEKAVPLIA